MNQVQALKHIYERRVTQVFAEALGSGATARTEAGEEITLPQDVYDACTTHGIAGLDPDQLKGRYRSFYRQMFVGRRGKLADRRWV